MILSTMPHLTLWQFYSQVGMQIVLGVAFVALMIWLGGRNPRLGWKSPYWAVKLRDGLAVVFIFMAGIASYNTLEDLFHAFSYDVADTVVEGGFDIIEKAASDDVSGGTISNAPVDDSAPVWGEAGEEQHTTLMLLAGFWICLGCWCYLLGYKSSYVGWWKKLLKPVGYFLAAVPLMLWPMEIHYFTWSELSTGVVMLIIGGVLILLTHDFSPAPPALPGSAISPVPDDGENEQFLDND